MSEFTWKTLYEILLSETQEDGKVVKKVARLINGCKVNKRRDADTLYHVNRLELRSIISGGTASSIGVSLAHSDFAWLMKCIKEKSPASVHVGKRQFAYQDLHDSTVLIGDVYLSRGFFVQLTEEDRNRIIQFEKIFDFFLRCQNIAGDRLRDLSVNLFVSILAKLLNPLVETKLAQFDDHNYSIKRISAIPGILKDINTILSQPDIDVQFNDGFVTLMDLINVKPSDRLTITQVVIPELKKDTDELLIKLNSYFAEKMDRTFEKVMVLKIDKNSK